jgi:glutamyl endopeptidase
MHVTRLTAAACAFAGTLAFAGITPAFAEILNPDATMSSDSSVPPSTRDGAANISRSFEGTDKSLAPLSAADMASYGARPLSADDLRRLRHARPRGGEPIDESVIGTDSRKKVINTKTYPARATVQILFTDVGDGFDYLCSGWLVNKNTVVTAGHCVVGETKLAFNKPATYRIIPGANGAARPYGSCRATKLFTNNAWFNNHNRDDYDYGAIKLDCNVGTTTGWYGYSKTVASGSAVTVEGYPGDKPSGTQWKMGGKVTTLQARRVFYKVDTFGGQSGSPVWRKIGTSCAACGVAIHAYGIYGPGAPTIYRTNNHGTRISTPVFQNITTWKNAP